MAAVVKGTAHVYGISGSVSNITVQSYTVSRSFELDDKVAGEHGRTITHRVDGRTNEISIEGVLQSASFSIAIGDRLQFAGNEIAFDGMVTRIEDRGQNKGFSLISVTAVSFEDITYS
ncbi:MAG: hypothetical protein ACK5VI_06555 [Opitutia bacterium]